jgi:hypothetical protein
MSEIFSSLQTLMVDHIRLSLMNQIQQNRNASISQLIFLALIVGVVSWFYDSVSSSDGKNKFIDLYVDWRSYIYRKNNISFEGKHVMSIDNFSRRPLIVSNTFSKNFRATLFYILKRIDTLKDVRELKEFATNIIKGEHYEENGDDVKTIFTVSQRLPFLIDEEKEIYCIVRETGEQKGEEPTNTITKVDSRFVKFNISLFSYKSSVPVIKEFVKSIKTEYSKYLEEKRRGKLFIYTLNNAEVQNDDTEDTVGGWKETPHETMKSFQNLFFEGKREVMEKIDFFINNKDWYKRNGIPYTLGIALYGPPGTGKTSFIKALSTYLNRHIISMTLSRIKTPKQLHDFYFETQYNNANDKNTLGFDKKIIVFEDIDCIGDIILKRKTAVDSKPDFSDIDSGEDQQDMEDYVNTAVNTTPEDQIRNEITKATKYVMKKINSNGCNNTLFNSQQDNIKLDDLLNLWDGIRENTGRIMIITTNHYDKLDPALIRPGRIDIALNLGNTSRETIAEMYMHYYRSVIDPNDYELIPDRFYSPAEIINIYVSNSTNPQGFIERLISKKKFNKE